MSCLPVPYIEDIGRRIFLENFLQQSISLIHYHVVFGQMYHKYRIKLRCSHINEVPPLFRRSLDYFGVIGDKCNALENVKNRLRALLLHAVQVDNFRRSCIFCHLKGDLLLADAVFYPYLRGHFVSAEGDIVLFL